VSKPIVTVARILLPAGLEPLRRVADVREGGLAPSRQEVLDLVAGATAVVADPAVPVDAELLDAAGGGLRVVANFAVGLDNVDIDACRERDVAVTNTPDVLTNATAELALALTLAAARHLPQAERDLREGRWKGWDPAAYRGLELSGATIGVVGLGRIGSRYTELVHGFGVELLYASRSAKPEAEKRLGAERVGIGELLERADVVSLHVPASPETRHLIDAAALARIKPGAVLVNTSRGALVDLAALAQALRDGRLGAAGLDVYEGEPDVPAEILEAPRTALTPHIGSATMKARDAMARTVAENVIALLEGREPPNRVD
jgi:glyoxylate reductase